MSMMNDKPDRRNVESPGRTREEKDSLRNKEPRPPPGSKPKLVPKPTKPTSEEH